MAYTKLRYHIVFATKYRMTVIDNEVEDFLYPVLGASTRNAGGCSIRIGGTDDHVHLICAIPPRLAVSEFIRDIKATSAGAVKAKFDDLNGFAWQIGFGGFTLNPFEMSDIISYVENQREHHINDDLRPRYERIDRGEKDVA